MKVTNTCSSSILTLVYNLKFVGPLEFEMVAPMPEQLKTTAMEFLLIGNYFAKLCEPC